MSAAGRVALIALLGLAGCRQVPDRAPPRATDTIAVPDQQSVIAVPISADLADLAATLNDAVPRRLWTIDRPGQTCVASKRVKLLFATIKTPTLTCRIVGQVTRGPMRVGGAGRDLMVRMPLHAVLSARDVGGTLAGETAEADAEVQARVRLGLTPDWTPRGSVDIAYDWTDPPHVDFLGQRIEITSKADSKLKGVVAKLERTLPAELGKLHFRERAAGAWRAAFTAVSLNKANPPVWMRITPRALAFGGYGIAHGRLTLTLGMTASTETYVGPRPADPAPTPLPRMSRLPVSPAPILFAIPVIADYRQLEPVIARALAKRSQRPFAVPGVGPVVAHFGKVTVYGTTGGKIAVGLRFSAALPDGAPSQGTIWLTALPINADNSRQVSFADLAVAGATDSTRTRLLIKLANTPGLSATLAGALTQNFADDYAKLLGRIEHAVAEKRKGDLLIRARILQVSTGRIKATGQAIYLPVLGRASASVELVPH